MRRIQLELRAGKDKQNVDVCVSEISEDLERVNQWAKDNELGINPTKSKSLVISKVPVDVSSI